MSASALAHVHGHGELHCCPRLLVLLVNLSKKVITGAPVWGLDGGGIFTFGLDEPNAMVEPQPKSGRQF